MKNKMILKAAMITAVITLGISGSAYAKDYPSKVYHLPAVKEKPEEEEPEKEEPEKAEEEKTEPAVTPAEGQEKEQTAAPEETVKEDPEAELADKKTEAPAPAAKEDLTIYVWEKDENGSLIFDKDGNPIPVLKKGQEIPKEFKRDENGELILDENGDPIVTFTVPEKSILIDSIKDALDKDRSIDIYVSFGEQEKVFGATVEFVAVLHGYDRVEYKIHWQHSKDNENWEIVPGVEGNRFSLIATEENYKDHWRAKVTITGVRKDD